ncbi:MAG TPA: CPBP family intramembrane glutamic endopeptidase [Actinomycetes bacterium]|nr:CPBP family intramembrane glutamic endopeptidase [Actinomycetes bacterium]
MTTGTLPAGLRRWLALLGPSTTPYHVETDAVRRRRRVVVTGTSVVGALLLALTLRTDAGSTAFYWYGALLAGCWIVGALLSGPLHLGRLDGRRHLLVPALLGVGAFAVFAVAAVVVRRVPTLDDLVSDVISRADTGSLSLVVAVALVNGLAEELFFRGALYSAFGRHRPWLWSTVAYVVVTAATLNLMLVLAAAAMGTLFALERRSTRGVLAPVVTHLTWSLLMIFFLPR